MNNQGRSNDGSDDIFDSLDLSEELSLGRPSERSQRTAKKKTRELNSAQTVIDTTKAKKEKDTRKKSKVKKIIFWSVLELFTLGAIFVYGYFLRSWNLITRPEVNESVIENHNLSAEKIAQMEQGYWTFAVFGVDGRNSQDLVSKGLNSDVIMIVNINQDTGEIRMCSVFRDTYLNISDNNRYRKINQAYSEGGPEQALAALNKNLDLNIKNYVTFNWKAVADGINILGGIDGIDISKAELFYINAFITETVNVTKIGSYQLKSTGVQHLDGVQAVAYGRLRLMDNDYARTERQKKVIKAAFDKAKESNFSVLNNIMVVCFPEVATNINFNTVVAMAQNITKYYISESGGFPWQRTETGAGSLGDVVAPATLESNVRYLHSFLFGDENYEPSSAVMSYSETIKEKTNVYKEGQVVDSVRTDGGLISMPKTTAAAVSETTGESKGDETEEEESETEAETDEEGNPIVPTDENGDPVVETDENGETVVHETRPTELDPEGGDEPGESTHGDDRPRETESGSQAGPGGQTGPGQTGPGSTQSTSGGPTPGGETGASSGSQEGPGGNGTGTVSETADVPGGPGSGNTSGGNSTPGGNNGPGGNTGDRPGELSPDSPGSPSGSPEGPGNSQGSITPGNTDGPGSGSSGGNAPGGGGPGSGTPGGQSPADAPIG